MFIVGGFNAYPAEIENLLLGDERIAQVAVVGMTDERLGEVGAAFVVPRSGVELTPDDVNAWAHERRQPQGAAARGDRRGAARERHRQVLKHEGSGPPEPGAHFPRASLNERTDGRNSTDAREHPALPHQRRGQPLQRAARLLRALHRPAQADLAIRYVTAPDGRRMQLFAGRPGPTHATAPRTSR